MNASRRPLKRLLYGSVVLLCGCYTVNQSALETNVHEKVQVGMSLTVATSLLQIDGFDCDARTVPPAMDCSRKRQPLALYACVERVRLFADADKRVTEVDVAKIACAGM